MQTAPALSPGLFSVQATVTPTRVPEMPRTGQKLAETAPKETTRGREVVTKDITKITWQKAGRVTEPGRYMFRFGWLTVTAEDLAVWRQFPEAAFTLVDLPDVAEDGREEFHLGAFELPLPPASDQH